jgi:hypothetical protein
MFYGNGNWTAGIKGNAVKGRQTGVNCIEFSDGSKITYELPGIIVKGGCRGNRHRGSTRDPASCMQGGQGMSGTLF